MEEDKGDKEQCYKIMKKPSNALKKCSCQKCIAKMQTWL